MNDNATNPIIPTTAITTRVAGSRLLFFRAIWVVIVVVGLWLTVAGAPARLAELSQVGLGADNVRQAPAIDEQLSQSQATELNRYGFSLRAYALYITAVEVTATLIFLFTALVIFLRRSDDWMAILVSAGIIALGVNEPTIDDALARLQPGWRWPIETLGAFAVCTFNFVFFLFPDGRFAPRWTRLLAVVGLAQVTVWLLVPTFPANPIYGTTWHENLPISSLIAFVWIGTGLVAQRIRYRRYATPTHQQQIKWVIYGYTGAVFAIFLRQLLLTPCPEALSHLLCLNLSAQQLLFLNLLRLPVFVLLSAVLPICFGVAIFRYRLWDIDLIIRRTTIYSLLTFALILIYMAVSLISQTIFKNLFPSLADLNNTVSAVAIVGLLRPLQQAIQQLIDRTFYRQRIDYQAEFTRFSRQIRLMIDLPKVIAFSLKRITQLFHSESSAIFLRNGENQFKPTLALRHAQDEQPNLLLTAPQLQQLKQGNVVTQPAPSTFPLLLPLTTPQASGYDLVGILALGPKRSEQPYSHTDHLWLINLAEQAGTAIAVAQSVESARLLEAYRQSPRGQAEQWLTELQQSDPETVLTKLYALACQAAKEPTQASLLINLVLVSKEQQADRLAGLAEGFHELLTSQARPDKLLNGLQLLIASLATQAALNQHPDQTLTLLKLCQSTLTATTVLQIERQWPDAGEQIAGYARIVFADLAHNFRQLQTYHEPLHRFLHVTTVDDQITYLLLAIEQLGAYTRQTLSKVEHLPDWLILQQIAAHWAMLVEQTLHVIRHQAVIEANLRTRQFVKSDAITLLLIVGNVGRGLAINLSVAIQPDPTYQIVEAQKTINELPPGKKVELSFTLQPQSAGDFLVVFRLEFDDQSTSGQQQWAEFPIHWLPVAITFRPIPNRYVAGMPLQPRSPTFFGRQDIFDFIQTSLSENAEGCTLVLTGQKRMGKTSLLKQLPHQLGSRYLPVYLDAQSLGIDPGPDSFFYDLARALATALHLPLPIFEHFRQRPRAFFEQEFLPQIFNVAEGKRILMLLDEFEEIEMRVNSGGLGVEIFSYLRYLIQTYPQLIFVFIGTHHIEELNPKYWSTFFNLALHRRIGFLERATACSLITSPVESYLYYDDLAVDRLMRLTAGHPYFLQLLCYILVNDANRAKRSYIDINHVALAADQSLEMGVAHFLFLWQQTSESEKRLLQTLAALIRTGVIPTLDTISQQLKLAGDTRTQVEVTASLLRLVQSELIQHDEYNPHTYRFVVDLLRLWIDRQ